jgi:hypothetical protein
MHYEMETGNYVCWTCGRCIDYRGEVLIEGDASVRHVRINPGSGKPEDEK